MSREDDKEKRRVANYFCEAEDLNNLVFEVTLYIDLIRLRAGNACAPNLQASKNQHYFDLFRLPSIRPPHPSPNR